MRKVGIIYIFITTSVLKATSPHLPPLYETSFHVVGNPVVDSIFTLTLKVIPQKDSIFTYVDIYTPPEVKIINGFSRWSGILSLNDTAYISLNLKITKQGRYNIFAYVYPEKHEEGYLCHFVENFYIWSTDTMSKYGEVPPESFFYELEVDTTPFYYPLGYTITVKGLIRYYNKDREAGNSNPIGWEPFPEVKVWIESKLPQTGVWHKVAEGHADENGNYSIPAINVSQDCRVKVKTSNYAVNLKNADHFLPIKEFNVTQNGTYYVNVDIDQSQAEWAGLMRNIRDAWVWSGIYFGVQRPQVDAYYKYDYNRGYYEYWNDKIFSGDVWDYRAEGFWMGHQICAHEYGHAFMYWAYGWSFPTYDFPSWEICDVEDRDFVWVEGWAEFYGAATTSWCAQRDYADFIHEWERFYAFRKWFNPIVPYLVGCEYNNNDGTKVIGAIAQLLFDLYDTPSFPITDRQYDDEGHTGPTVRIYNAFLNCDSIQDFLYNWEQLGYPDISEIVNVDFYWIKPPAPSNLHYSVTENSVTLYWNDNSEREGKFIIWKKREGSYTWEKIELSPNTSHYVDEGLEFNTTYYYKIAALTCDTSEWAGPIQVTTSVLNKPNKPLSNLLLPL